MMSATLGFTYFILFILIIRRLRIFQLPGFRPSLSAFLFSLKALSGLVLWAIYTFYYTDRGSADIYKYFDDAETLYQQLAFQPLAIFQLISGMHWNEEIREVLLQTQHWYREYNFGMLNDNRTVISLNLLIRHLSFGSFHVHNLFFAFFSFSGSIALYRFFLHYLPQRKIELLAATFLFPTVLFWSSSVLKESWLFCCMGWFLYHFLQAITYKHAKHYAYCFVWMILLIFIKPYVFLCLLPALFYLLLPKQWGSLKRLALVLFSISICTSLIMSFLPQWNPFLYLQAKQTAFYNQAALIQSGSLISIPEVGGPLKALFALPVVWKNVLFLPHLLGANNVLELLAAFENTLLIVLMLWTAFRFQKAGKEVINLIMFSLLFVAILAALIGWTTPVLGAIVRYKAPLIPFFGVILIALSRPLKYGSVLKKLLV